MTGPRSILGNALPKSAHHYVIDICSNYGELLHEVVRDQSGGIKDLQSHVIHKSNMPQPHKYFYKGEEQDFIIFLEDQELLERYKNHDTTIPLIDVVSVYKIFTNRQGGSEGVLDEASKQELKNEFGTANVDEIIKKIIKDGDDKNTTSIYKGHNSTNDADGGQNANN